MPEEEVMKVRNSRKAYFFVYLMVFVLLVAVIAIKILGKELNEQAFNVVIAFSVATVILIEFHRLMDYYEINSSSLTHSSGILSRKIRKVDLVSVSDADSKQTAWQRMLGYGDVNARLFSEDSTISIKNINNPVGFADFLEKKMNEKKNAIPNIKGQNGNRIL